MSLCHGQESRDVAELDEPLLRGEAEDARHIAEHAALFGAARPKPGLQFEACCGEEARQCFPRGARRPAFDSGDNRLRSGGAPSEVSLSEASAHTSIAEQLAGRWGAHNL